MRYIIGAYVASPTLDQWDAKLETAYYEGLKHLDGLRGLEHPFYGSLHRDDDAWFLSNIDPAWEFVLTCIPGTMDRLVRSASFGLASDDEAGRRAAVDFHRGARDAVRRVHDHLGRKAVCAVQLHSSPRQPAGSGSAEAFARSLREIVTWDWDGAPLCVEHCDALVCGQVPEKGFLELNEELRAIDEADVLGRLGITINWGRSAIEGRSAETPLEHVHAAAAAGVLAGLMFSGVSSDDGPYGAWKDTHMPPRRQNAESALPQNGCMTVHEMARCLAAANDATYIGAKVMNWPKTPNASASLSMLAQTIQALDAARESIAFDARK